MKREPDFDQFVQVMQREVEPDWVPLSEFGIDWGVMAEIQGPPKEGEDQSAWLVRFWRDMGFDYLSQGVNVGFPHGTRIAEDTAPLSHGTRAWALGSGNTIANYMPPGNFLTMLDEAKQAR